MVSLHSTPRLSSCHCWGDADYSRFRPGSLFSHLTLQAHAVKPPVIPCVFDYRTDSAINVDLFGVPFGFGSADPPMVGAAQPTKNQVCILHYRVMEYNTSLRAAVGTEVDMVVRRAFFQELADLDKALPPHLHHRTNLTPQTLNLRWVRWVVTTLAEASR